MSKELDKINEESQKRLVRDLEAYGHLLGTMSRAELRRHIRSVEGERAPAVSYRCRLMLSWRAKEHPELQGRAKPRVTVEPDKDESHLEVSARGQGLVRNLRELIEESGVDTKVWVPVGEPTINTWTSAMMRRLLEFDDEGNRVIVTRSEIVQNWQVKSKFAKRLYVDDYRPPPVQIVRVGPPPEPVDYGDDIEVGVLLPDAQIGYIRRRDGRLEPTHDVRALDAAMQLMEIIQPHRSGWLGDNLDLAEISTYRKLASMMDLARPGIAEYRYWLARHRAAVPNGYIETREGNHEDRLSRVIVEYLAGFADVQKENEPYNAFSLQALIRPEEFNIAYFAPYRQDVSWWWDRVKVHHGEIVRPNSGGTVQSIAFSGNHSEVVGHIHRSEVCHVTEDGPQGLHTRFAASPGCLCRTAPGVVPGYKAVNNWQNALAVLFFNKRTGQESIQLIPIHNGALMWGGRLIQGRNCTREIEASTGILLAHDWLRPGE